MSWPHYPYPPLYPLPHPATHKRWCCISLIGMELTLFSPYLLLSLPSHLESVRTVAFGDEGLSLVSGGDDMTVKLWRLDPRGFGLSK